jgi:hypothetical protein
VLDEVDAVASLADHRAERRLEQHGEVLGQVVGALHADAQGGPDAAVGAVAAD